MVNISHKSILNNKGPSIDTWRTPIEIVSQKLHDCDDLNLSLQFIRWSSTNFVALDSES